VIEAVVPAVAKQQDDELIAAELAQQHQIARFEVFGEHLMSSRRDPPGHLAMGIDAVEALDLLEAHRIDHDHAERTALGKTGSNVVDLLADAAQG
jgi:hypothetical protein